MGGEGGRGVVGFGEGGFRGGGESEKVRGRVVWLGRRRRMGWDRHRGEVPGLGSIRSLAGRERSTQRSIRRKRSQIDS